MVDQTPNASESLATNDSAVVAGRTGYRYPGSPPFTDTDLDRLLFRGRAAEADAVLHSILGADLFVLYAISGMGKTSLLNAGVAQQLRERDLWPLFLRLNDPLRSPVNLIEAQIREAAATSEDISVTYYPSEESGTDPATLWDLLSRVEVWKGNRLQKPVLIFDQFEELFTLSWNDETRQRFIVEFGEIVRRHRAPDKSGGAPIADLLPPPRVKIVLVIREDSLGELEAFTMDVPQIMRHRFRLIGLEPEQAEAAIREPALVDDDRLRSQRFAYSDGAAQTLLAFLRIRDERGQQVVAPTVEPSQLQIVCQHVERAILPDKRRRANPDGVVEITEQDLGGPEGLNRILRDFYRREVESFASKDRELIRLLCETGLISQASRRLSLEEGEIEANFGVPRELLAELVERRLLRAEPRVGSVYYELAHDTLVAPILAYRRHLSEAVAATGEDLLRAADELVASLSASAQEKLRSILMRILAPPGLSVPVGDILIDLGARRDDPNEFDKLVTRLTSTGILESSDTFLGGTTYRLRVTELEESWEYLADLIHNEQEPLKWLVAVQDRHALWKSSDEARNELLTRADLAMAEYWSRERPEIVTADEHRFIRESLQEFDRTLRSYRLPTGPLAVGFRRWGSRRVWRAVAALAAFAGATGGLFAGFAVEDLTPAEGVLIGIFWAVFGALYLVFLILYGGFFAWISLAPGTRDVVIADSKAFPKRLADAMSAAKLDRRYERVGHPSILYYQLAKHRRFRYGDRFWPQDISAKVHGHSATITGPRFAVRRLIRRLGRSGS